MKACPEKHQSTITNWEAAWLCIAGMAVFLGGIPPVPQEGATTWQWVVATSDLITSLAGTVTMAWAAQKYMRRWSKQ